MFLETVHTEGLAHLSYIFGDSGQAAVVDPRRDCETYIEIAYKNGSTISHIFETHRNEDYVIGSRELSAKTGASIYHGKTLDFHYGNPVSGGDTFEIGNIKLTVLETPGHTYESISLVMVDGNFSGDPIAVFTGDALFVGDVGRTDFFPDQAEEVAGLLYDSIFEKLLPLGDHVLLYPAHGAGSVCGIGMADREFSTLGYERKNNPVLQKSDRREFIQYKVREHHYQPPYFRQMELYNQFGDAPILGTLPPPRPMNADVFSGELERGMTVIDVRSPEAFGGALIPNSIAIPLSMIPAFAGWFLAYDKPLGLVVETYDQVEPALCHLRRLGFDQIVGFLSGGLGAWETKGFKFDTIPAVHVDELVNRILGKERFTLLDVRTREEFKAGHLPRAKNLYVGELIKHLDQVPKDQPLTTFCGSGTRAVIAASLLKRAGYDKVENCLGSMLACSAYGCPIKKETV
jgi:hydroxyacylglutathione hydrolase